MAYNPYLNPAYPPAFFNQQNAYYQQLAQQQAMMQQAQAQQAQAQQMQPPTIQQSGFVLVQSEQEARAYPVAPGNSITFKDERLPFCYVKTMGFSQLDRPTFERYRLVKEDSPADAGQAPEVTGGAIAADQPIAYALRSELDDLRSVVDELREKLKTQRPVKKKTAEMEGDKDDE